jgi:dihydroorotase
MSQAIKKMSVLPAKIFRLKAGSLALGSKADIVIIDPKKKWTIDSSKFYSKGRNCPFDEWEVQGKAVMTIVKGKIVMKDNEIIV